MATEAVFRAAADSFDGWAASLRSEFSSVDSAWGDDVVVGGRLAVTIDRAIDATHANTMTVVAELQTLADECRRRAAVCAEYSAAMANYRRRLRDYERAFDDWRSDPVGSPPWRPARPTKPAAWVDETSPSWSGW